MAKVKPLGFNRVETKETKAKKVKAVKATKEQKQAKRDAELLTAFGNGEDVADEDKTLLRDALLRAGIRPIGMRD